MMNGKEISDVARVVAKGIAANVNPNDWNLAARMVAEELGLDVCRVEFRPALDMTAFALVSEASKQGKTGRQVIDAAIKVAERGEVK